MVAFAASTVLLAVAFAHLGQGQELDNDQSVLLQNLMANKNAEQGAGDRETGEKKWNIEWAKKHPVEAAAIKKKWAKWALENPEAAAAWYKNHPASLMQQPKGDGETGGKRWDVEWAKTHAKSALENPEHAAAWYKNHRASLMQQARGDGETGEKKWAKTHPVEAAAIKEKWDDENPEAAFEKGKGKGKEWGEAKPALGQEESTNSEDWWSDSDS